MNWFARMFLFALIVSFARIMHEDLFIPAAILFALILNPFEFTRSESTQPESSSTTSPTVPAVEVSLPTDTNDSQVASTGMGAVYGIASVCAVVGIGILIMVTSQGGTTDDVVASLDPPTFTYPVDPAQDVVYTNSCAAQYDQNMVSMQGALESGGVDAGRIDREMADARDSVALVCSLEFDISRVRAATVSALEVLDLPAQIIAIVASEDIPLHLQRYAVLHQFKKVSVLLNIALAHKPGTANSLPKGMDEARIARLAEIGRSLEGVVLKRSVDAPELLLEQDVRAVVHTGAVAIDLTDFGRFAVWRSIDASARLDSILTGSEIAAVNSASWLLDLNEIAPESVTSPVKEIHFYREIADLGDCRLAFPDEKTNRSEPTGCFDAQSGAVLIATPGNAEMVLNVDEYVVIQHELLHSFLKNGAHQNAVIAEGSVTALSELSRRSVNAAVGFMKRNPLESRKLFEEFVGGMANNKAIEIAMTETYSVPPSALLIDLACNLGADPRTDLVLPTLVNRERFHSESPKARKANYALATFLYFPLAVKGETMGQLMEKFDARSAELAKLLSTVDRLDDVGKDRITELEMQSRQAAVDFCKANRGGEG